MPMCSACCFAVIKAIKYQLCPEKYPLPQARLHGNAGDGAPGADVADMATVPAT